MTVYPVYPQSSIVDVPEAGRDCYPHAVYRDTAPPLVTLGPYFPEEFDVVPEVTGLSTVSVQVTDEPAWGVVSFTLSCSPGEYDGHVVDYVFLQTDYNALRLPCDGVPTTFRIPGEPREGVYEVVVTGIHYVEV